MARLSFAATIQKRAEEMKRQGVLQRYAAMKRKRNAQRKSEVKKLIKIRRRRVWKD